MTAPQDASESPDGLAAAHGSAVLSLSPDAQNRIADAMYRGIFTTDACEAAITDLRTNGSKAAPGYKFAEGIVIFHTAANSGFKKTLEKDEMPKCLQAPNDELCRPADRTQPSRSSANGSAKRP